MPIRADELFFQLAVKGGAAANRAMQQFSGGLDRAGRAARRARGDLTVFSERTTVAERTTKGLSRSITRLVGIFGGLYAIRKIIGVMSGFETAMAEVATIAGGGADAIAGLRREVLALAHDVPQTPEQLTRGLYQILSAGVESAHAMEVLEASSKAAVAGLTDTATAVDAVTTILNAFRLEADQATRVTDLLFETVRLGKLRFDDVATSIGTAATSASLAGVTVEELTAAMATMTLAGVDAQEATASLNRLFLTLVSQSKEQQKAFERLHIGFNTATVAEKGFAGLLEEVNKLTEGQLDSLAKLFPEIRAARSAFVLAGNSLDRYKEILEATRNSSGSAEAAFAIMSQTLDNQYKLLSNQVNVAFQQLAVDVIPYLIRRIQDLRIAFDALFDPQGEKVRRFAREWGAFVRQIQDTGQFALGARTVTAEIEQRRAQARELEDEIAELYDPKRFGTKIRAALDQVLFQGGTRAARISGLVEQLDEVNAELKALEQAAKEIELGSTFQEGRTEVDKFVESFRGQIAALKEAKLETEDRLLLERALRERGIADAEDMLKTLELEGAEQARLKTFIDQQRIAIGQLSASREEDADVAKKQQAAQEQLLRLVSDVTKSAAEQQIEAIAKLKTEYAEAFKGISAEAEKQFAIVEEAARHALREEQAAESVAPLQEALKTGLEEIELATLDIVDAEDRRRAQLEAERALAADILAQAEARLDSSETTVEQERELLKIVAALKKFLGEAADEQERLGDVAGDDADQRFRNLQHTVSLIQQSVDGALELAKAFGLVDDQLAGVIKGLQEIGTGTATLAGAIQAKNPQGIVAGALQLAGGVANVISSVLAESPEEAERKRIAEENIRALEELTYSVDSLRGSLDLSGADVSRALRALSGFDFSSGAFVGGIQLAHLRTRLAELGLTLRDLDEIAEELGITIRNSDGAIIAARLNDLNDALEIAAEGLIGFPDTLEGALREAELTSRIYDLDDPALQLAARLAGLVDASDEFTAWLDRMAAEGRDATEALGEWQAGLLAMLDTFGDEVLNIPALRQLFALDLTTAEGRAQADALIRDLFRQFQAGTLDIAALGFTAPQEFLDFLASIEELLDEIEANTADQTAAAEGATQGVHFSTQVTEAQGDALLAREDTQIYFAREELTLSRDRNALLESMLAALGGQLLVPPPALSPAGGALPASLAGGTEINVGPIGPINLHVGAGATPDMAREAADVFVESVDRRLGEKLLAQLRLRGRA